MVNSQQNTFEVIASYEKKIHKYEVSHILSTLRNDIARSRQFFDRIERLLSVEEEMTSEKMFELANYLGSRPEYEGYAYSLCSDAANAGYPEAMFMVACLLANLSRNTKQFKEATILCDAAISLGAEGGDAFPHYLSVRYGDRL